MLDSFNANNAYVHTKELSFPRATGSPGEKEAQEYILNVFRSLNLEVESQEFKYSTFPLSIVARFFLLCLIALEISIYLCYEKFPLISLILSILTIYMILSSTKWRKSYNVLYNIPWGVKNSLNLIGKNIVKGATKNLIFLAHYDSKSQTLPAFWRAFSFGSSLLGSTLLIGMTIIISLSKIFQYNNSWEKSFLFYICLLTIISIILLMLNRSSNLSPGSLDNASGIGVLLELARILPGKLKNTNLIFVATGAEEDGLCGAIRYMETYRGDNSYFINFDGPGAEGKLIITSFYGIPPINTGGLLTPLALKIAEIKNYPLLKGYIPLGAGLDQFPVSAYGFPVITVSSGKLFSKIIFSIHSPNDTMDLISTKALKHSGELSYNMAVEIDRFF